ncbi:MAG: GGDEF domain-containing protein [Spirochaetes bacterium]|nr:GGDEF domain-containing protein [Spirochaetota bacterium]
MQASSSKKTYRIAALTPSTVGSISDSWMNGMAEYAAQHGVDLTVFRMRTDYRYLTPELCGRMFDGLIINCDVYEFAASSADVADLFRRYRALAPHAVSIGVRVGDAPCITSDGRGGIRSLTAHMFDRHACRRPKFFLRKNPRGVIPSTWQDRYLGFADELISRGMDPEKHLIVLPKNDDDMVAAAVAEHDSVYGPADAFLGFDEPMLVLLYRYCRNMKLRIGVDVRLAGFGYSAGAFYDCHMPLTIVEPDWRSVGARSVECILRLCRGEPVDRDVSTPCSLTIRNSCGCSPELASYHDDVPAAHDASAAEHRPDGFDAHEAELKAVLTGESNERDVIISLYHHLLREQDHHALVERLPRLVSLIREYKPDNPALPMLATSMVYALVDRIIVTRRMSRESFSLQVGGFVSQLGQAVSMPDLRLRLEHFLRTFQIPFFMLGLYVEEAVSAETSRMHTDMLEPFFVRPDVTADDASSRTAVDIAQFFRETIARHGTPAARIVMPLSANDVHMGFQIAEINGKLQEPLQTFELTSSVIASAVLTIRLLSLREQVIAELKRSLATLSRYSKKVEAISRTDELTGLYNRRGFLDEVNEYWQETNGGGDNCRLFLIDLDYLKKINDNYGHADGDIAIKGVASILKQACRETDIAARFGGDEFVIFAKKLPEAAVEGFLARLSRIADEVNRQLNKPYRVSFSLGHTLCVSNDGGTLPIDDLLKEADAMLYRMKKARTPNP